MASRLRTLLVCGIAGLAAAQNASRNDTSESAAESEPLAAAWVPAADNASLNDTWASADGNASTSAGANETTLGASLVLAFSTDAAVEAAYLATAAYCYETIGSWSCGLPCLSAPGMTDVRLVDEPKLGAHAYVGRLRGQCALVFRGTSDGMGWVSNIVSAADLDPMPGCSVDGTACEVGAGWLKQWQALQPMIKSALADIGCSARQPLLITGHSQGGALATLAHFDLLASGWSVPVVYTFGSPRVGDKTFVAGFEQKMQATGSANFRVALEIDPVVYVPLPIRFAHVGTEVFYRSDNSLAATTCGNVGGNGCAVQQVNAVELTQLLVQCTDPETCGHFKYMWPDKKGPMSYSSCGAPLQAFEMQVILP